MAETTRRRKPLEERFWPKVDKTAPNGCWEWTGTRRRDGYGQIWYGENGVVSLRCHRVSYEWAKGPIPDGLVLDHLCRNRACVNPDHLEPVTVIENNLRGLSWKHQYNAETCRSGRHPWPEDAYFVSPGVLTCRPCLQERGRRAKAVTVECPECGIELRRSSLKGHTKSFHSDIARSRP